jgi:hypothetical protein
MAYKYYSSVTMSGSPSQTLIGGFQALLNDQFSVSSDVFTIQEEVTLGSNVLTDIQVRVNTAIQSQTGLKLGDDFKNLLFKDISHSVVIGKKYYFDNNYWISVFTEAIKNLAASCMVRRCNNVLRWCGSDGTIYSEPCSIDYQISRPRDMMGTNNPVMPAGYIKIYTQYNARTKKIKGNQRFMFGPPENRICFKVFGDGLTAFLNQQTLDDTSSSLLELQVGGNFINPDTDDLVNGIADRYLDYRDLTSGSAISPTISIVVSPDIDYVYRSGSATFNVQYYSGSVATSGSFVLSDTTGSYVPSDHYAFIPVDGNNFILWNNETYMTSPVTILASGSSGSRVLDLYLRGDF